MRVCWEEWQNHPNSDLDHFKLVCRLRPEVECPHVTVMERDDQPCALLVSRLERTRLVPSIGYFKPIQIPAKVLTVLYQGLLGQVSEKIAEALVRHLLSLLASGEADAVAFHRLCEKTSVWSEHWSMALPEEPGFLMKKMKSKHRGWIRNRQRKLESAFPGKVSWRWMNCFNDVLGLCARLEDVAARTYQRGLGAGFVDDEEHRRRFALFANRGQLRIQLLEIDRMVQAFWIGTIYKGIFHSSATGYNPDLHAYEPGTLIFLRMVDELVREGIHKLDFGLGDAFYKKRFGDHSWRETTVRLFAPTAKGSALRSVLRAAQMLDDAGRRLVQRAGVFDRLKTGWRRRMGPTKPEADKK